ncbi:MAG: hypothetical protein AB1566_11405 [Chloroflexota bacterium]
MSARLVPLGRRLNLLILLILLSSFTACSTLEVRIERTPTPSHTATATVATPSATFTAPTSTPVLALGRLAYLQGGDIWVKGLPDGKAQRLTTDGCNREPRWSPSGQWLAFRKGDYQVWVMRADGSAARPLNEGAAVRAFAWAPMADRLAYVTGTGALVALKADGSSQQKLVTQGSGGPYTGVVSMAWSPDGEWLAYEQVEVRKAGEEGQAPERYAGLWRIRADGSGAIELLNAGTPAAYEPILAGWSLDGSRILFWLAPHFSRSILADGTSLTTIPANGGEPSEVVRSMLAYSDFLAPSPEGKLLAITEGGGRETWSHKRIAVVDLSSGKLTYLTDDKTAAFSPAWSPDGQRIVYAAAPDIGFIGGGEAAKAGAAQRRIWLMKRDGSDKRQLTKDATYRDERPLWSADGSYILFARLDTKGHASLWLISAEGDNPHQVVDELTPAPSWFGYYGHIDWDVLFDWWRGPAVQQVQPVATATAPASAPTPIGSMPAPTSPPTPTGPTAVDCAAMYPGLPGCLRREPLVGGRLAFVSQRPPFSGGTTVLDLEHGKVWTLGKPPLTLLEQSPSGEHLLLTEYDGRYSIYRYDGVAVNSFRDLPAPPFWAPLDAFPSTHDWLAAPTAYGALLAVPFPQGKTRQVLPPGSLGRDGRGIVRWSPDGWLAWSLNTDQLVDVGQFDQVLYVRRADGDGKSTTWRLSDDVRKTYYQLIGWVPGTRLILAGRGRMAVSLWVDGVPLVAINADTGEKTDLGARMLLTSEAYAWHPTRRGLLALTEGGGRFLFTDKRLALLDVTTNTLTYLTGEEMAVFEPAWSPDGRLLAYAAVRASPNATGDSKTLEHALDGRAIYIVNPQTGETRVLTHPGDAVDGWPRWSADRTHLLYTRQHDGYTDVRVVTLEGSRDELLVTALADPMCYYGGCGWWRMLAFRP